METSEVSGCIIDWKQWFLEFARVVINRLDNIERRLDKLENNHRVVCQNTLEPCLGNEEDVITLKGGFQIKKSFVEGALETKKTITAYFRALVLENWDREILKESNLCGGGKFNRKPLNRLQVEAYLDYTIQSWNEYKMKTNNSSQVYESSSISAIKSDLRTILNSICNEERRKFKRPRNSNSEQSTNDDGMEQLIQFLEIKEEY